MGCPCRRTSPRTRRRLPPHVSSSRARGLPRRLRRPRAPVGPRPVRPRHPPPRGSGIASLRPAAPSPTAPTATSSSGRAACASPRPSAAGSASALAPTSAEAAASPSGGALHAATTPRSSWASRSPPRRCCGTRAGGAEALPTGSASSRPATRPTSCRAPAPPRPPGGPLRRPALPPRLRAGPPHGRRGREIWRAPSPGCPSRPQKLQPAAPSRVVNRPIRSSSCWLACCRAAEAPSARRGAPPAASPSRRGPTARAKISCGGGVVLHVEALGHGGEPQLRVGRPRPADGPLQPPRTAAFSRV